MRMDDARKQEVLEVIAAYSRAVRGNDKAALDVLIAYPLAAIVDGSGIRMIDNLNAMQAETRARTGWHDTKDENYEVVFASADKAHVILRPATRVRANGSAIATISAFYALTRRSSGWKIFVISAVIEPA